MKRHNILFLIALTLLAGSLFSQTPLVTARKLMTEKQINDALRILRNYVSNTPRDVQGWITLAEAYLLADKPDSAEIAGKRAVDVDSDIFGSYIALAHAQQALKKYKEAVKTYQEALKLRTKENKFTLLCSYGDLLMEMDSLKLAEVVYTQAKEENPNSPVIYIALAITYNKLGVIPMAILQYEKAVSLDSSNVEVFFELAKLYTKEKRYNEAARAYQTVVVNDSTNRTAMFELGRLYFLAKQYLNAAKIFYQFVRRFNNDDQAWQFDMEANFAARSFEEAAFAAEEILKKKSKDETVLRIAAISNYELKNYKAAAKYFELWEQVDTLKVDEYRKWGRCYEQLKQDTMIVRIYSKALQLDSTQIELYNVVGIILMNRRDYEGAALAFEQRFLRDPNATSAYLNYALCNTSMKRWEAAKTALRKVNEAKPDYIPGFLHLARIYMQQDSIEEAVEPYQIVVKLAEPQAVKYKAELGEAYRVIGLMHLVKKRHSEAVKALTASIKYQDNNPKAHLWLAQSYHALEKYEDAIREYRIVLKYDKNDKDAQKGLKLLGEEF